MFIKVNDEFIVNAENVTRLELGRNVNIVSIGMVDGEEHHIRFADSLSGRDDALKLMDRLYSEMDTKIYATRHKIPEFPDAPLLKTEEEMARISLERVGIDTQEFDE